MNKIIGIIPARINSKRLKRKNLFILNGKPLIKLARRLGVQCSVVSNTERFVSNQKKPYNSNYVKCHTAHSIRNNYNGSQDLSRCGSCSACWNQSVDTIYYEIH